MPERLREMAGAGARIPDQRGDRAAVQGAVGAADEQGTVGVADEQGEGGVAQQLAVGLVRDGRARRSVAGVGVGQGAFGMR